MAELLRERVRFRERKCLPLVENNHLANAQPRATFGTCINFGLAGYWFVVLYIFFERLHLHKSR